MKKFEQTEKVFLELIKQIAIQKGISQVEIAENMGIRQPNVNKLLNGKYSPTVKDFLHLCESVGINFFFQDKDSKTDLNLLFEKSMEEIGRRLPENRDN